MTTLPETIEIETGAKPDAAVIWLHGLGADGHDFEPVVPALQLPDRLSVRFVFPNAPVRPVTLNMGMPMRAWYDIIELGGGREDEAGIRESQQLVEDLIAREKSRGIVSSRIVLAGFSQGGAIVLFTAIRHPERLAGVMALSTYLAVADTHAAERDPANLAVPIFMAHGTQDEMIGNARAQNSRAKLEALGYPVEWHEYAMGHSVCPQEVADIGDWLAKVL